MRPLITLTTDFNAGSGYVAQMKGVILSICREAELIDISHAVRPQDIRQGAVLLADVTPRFPSGTIHVAVVDPGVGTSRRIVYTEIGKQRYIAPDNGLLSYLAAGQPPKRLVSVENRRFWLADPSSTFHGRDIMAPVAAHLAAGVEPSDVGPEITDLAMLSWPVSTRSRDAITGQVLLVDSFGNLITNIDRQMLTALGEPSSVTVEIAGHRIQGLVPTYGAAASGALVALFDSQDRLEIAQVNGNAAATLRAGDTTPLTVRLSAFGIRPSTP